MLLVLLAAAAVLLFFFGLLWPEKWLWLKWLARAAGALGTLFILLLLLAVSSAERLPLVDGEPVERAVYAAALAFLALVFWLPCLGLALGRGLGRWARKVGRDAQEMHL